jgi:hypothetical protein
MLAGLITILLFLLYDLARLRQTGELVDLAVLAMVAFWAIAPVLACATIAWVSTRLWCWLEQHGRASRDLAAFVIGAAAVGPAYQVGRGLTRGPGIRASGWADPVCHAVGVGLPLVFVALTLLWPRLRAAPAVRLSAGGALVCAGLAGVLLLGFHPVAYMEAHRGLLLLATVLLLCALALLQGEPTRRRGFLAWRISHGRFVLVAAALALVNASVVFMQSNMTHYRIAATVFRGTLVAQKLHPLWLSVAPKAAQAQAPEIDALRSPAPPERKAMRGRWAGHDIVLVTVDALRADAIDPSSGNTPTLADLQRRAWVFNEAITDYSHTTRALATLMQGSPIGQLTMPARK